MEWELSIYIHAEAETLTVQMALGWALSDPDEVKEKPPIHSDRMQHPAEEEI